MIDTLKNKLGIEKNDIYFISIFFFIASLLRLIYLGSRSVHHDESLHGYYSWALSIGNGYEHNPLMHGPLWFHLNAFIFFIFGDSNYMLRLLPAIIGSLVVISPFLFINHIGKKAAYSTSFLILISPIFLYFSRFARNDIMLALTMILSIYFIFNYVSESKNKLNLLAISSILSIGFCIKETQYIFVLLIVVYSFLFSKWNPLLFIDKFNFKYSKKWSDIFILVFTLTLPLAGPIIGIFDRYTGLSMTSPSGSMKVGMPEGISVYLAIALTIILFLISFIIGYRWKKFEWLKSAGLFWFIYLFFYTTIGSNFSGLSSGIWQSLGYWVSQQDVARGSQPWYYFIIVLASYEFLVLFLLIISLIGYKKLTSELSKFLVFWFIFNLIAYGIASEKMPWLAINMLIPIIFLSGISLQRLIFSKIKNKNIHAILIVLILISGILTLKISIDSSFNKPEYPDEIIVYTQTSANVHNLVNNIKLYSLEKGSVSIAIDSSEGFTWPWAWYLRNFDMTLIDVENGMGIENNIFETFDFIVLNTKFENKVLSKIDSDSFNIERLPFRQWYPENYRFNNLENLGKYLSDTENFNKTLRHIIFKDTIKTVGKTEITILTKK